MAVQTAEDVTITDAEKEEIALKDVVMEKEEKDVTIEHLEAKDAMTELQETTIDAKAEDQQKEEVQTEEAILLIELQETKDALVVQKAQETILEREEAEEHKSFC